MCGALPQKRRISDEGRCDGYGGCHAACSIVHSSVAIDSPRSGLRGGSLHSKILVIAMNRSAWVNSMHQLHAAMNAEEDAACRSACRWPDCGCSEVHSIVDVVTKMARRIGGTFEVDKNKLGTSPLCRHRDAPEMTMEQAATIADQVATWTEWVATDSTMLSGRVRLDEARLAASLARKLADWLKKAQGC
jgi:hypothetical protein